MNNPDQKTVIGKDTVHIELAPPSFTMRVGKRRLTMSWRARKPVPVLLTGLLRRSWRAMFGRGLRISMTAAAICAAWNVPALAAAPPVNTLPTGGVITSGTATITQNGNTLNINQSTQQAIGNFTSFSIGANATVDISQPNSAAAFLARVTGTDPSLIYGHLKANGMVALINQNGIMVGPGGVVDVARFIASTLNITDGDFLAGRLTFNAGATVGNVVNEGTIKTGTGGSVYLIGANVSNSGVIQSPNGEILLAAGQTVQLVDTATPGVTVNVTGIAGSVTNLGTITAEAGRIGIAAGLINNSGNINASSVVSEGGRIFLRASQNLTTTASSKITADGATKGGSVVLYSDGAAYIDGDVSARGAPGQGGFVETSGLKSLDVVKTPTVGSGGTWYIDPYDLEVVSDAVATANTDGTSVISSVGNSSKIRASTIVGLLNVGTDVTLATGNSGGADAGDITISAAINKTGGDAASLTLNADNNIIINADITSTSNALNLNLNTNVHDASAGTHSAQLNGARIALNSGVLNVSEGSGNVGNGNLNIIHGGVFDLGSNRACFSNTFAGSLFTGNLTVDATSSVVDTANYNGQFFVNGTLANQGTVSLNNISGTVGTFNNDGVVNLNQMRVGSGFTVSGAFTNNSSGTLNINDATSSGLALGQLGNAGAVNVVNSTLNAAAIANAGTVNLTNTVLNSSSINNLGIFNVNYNTTFVYALTNNGVMNLDSTANKPNGYTGKTEITFNGDINNYGTLNVTGQVFGLGDVQNGNSDHPTGTVNMKGGSFAAHTFTNANGATVAGTGSIAVGGDAGTFFNNGVLAPGGDGTVGTLTINGGYTQGSTGSLLIDIAGNTAGSYDVLNINGSNGLNLDGTLQTKLLNNYTPLVDDAFAAINGPAATGGVFRHVLGDVLTTGGAQRMIKARYNSETGLSLVMSAPETLTFAADGYDSWGNASAWSTGYFPTAIDNVVVASSSQLSHNNTDGIDIVKSITFNDDSGLNINGGTVKVGNIISLGHSTVSVSGEGGGGGGEGGGEGFNGFNNVVVTDPSPNSGVLNISGSARVSSLTLSGTGTVNGDVNSALSVTDSFSQSNGSVINSNGSVSLSQATGDLVVGNITARNLVLESQNGAIMQTAALHVTRQLLASSVTGLTLDNGANRIAAFAANNRGINDIILRNNLDSADTSVFRINGVTNANGSISIINTGATATTSLGSGADFLTTLPTAPDLDPVPTLADRLNTLGIVSNGTVSAGMLSHTVTIEAHSPLTIGSGGITAAGGIALAAGTAGSGSSNDSLVVNGQLASAGGTINLVAGGSLNINANITGAYTPGVPAPVYGPGVMLNGVQVGPSIQTNPTTTPITVATDTTSQIDRSVNNTQTTTTSTPSTSGTNPVIDNTQTTGGGAGSFGGDDAEPASGQSKPAGVKKVSKLYCS
ncbi:beta strand repeat-containing protein [Herbaspirillum sp. NPDC101397]|uniref:beta strand repeat-containing protein n=1 Tax=Herbaspirillum sp. NPDC101397 TaxID=3364006 RepID=UPI00383A5F14